MTSKKTDFMVKWKKLLLLLKRKQKKFKIHKLVFDFHSKEVVIGMHDLALIG